MTSRTSYWRSRALTLCLITPTAALAQTTTDELHTFLRTQIGYSDTELSALDSGKAVTRTLDTEEAREVAISEAVHIRATTDFFLRMYQDIERFDTAALSIKKISDAPQREDFASMTLPEKDLSALQKCEPNDCNMQRYLDASKIAIERYYQQR